MANLTPIESFDDVVQLETNTIALGGVGGPMNAQAQALLNRTAYLKGLVDGFTEALALKLNANANTDAVTEGSANLYFTNSRAISAVTSTINTAITNCLTPTINNQAGASYTLQTADNDGKTILRMTSASANTVEIPSTLTLPISVRQAGTGTTTLQAGSGVTLNGTLAFTAQHQTKTIYRVSSGIYDVVG